MNEYNGLQKASVLLIALGPEKALTGPAKRGDINTINKHKLMLDNNLEEKMIYEMLTNYILNKY